jgi:hypothetical protein
VLCRFVGQAVDQTGDQLSVVNCRRTGSRQLSVVSYSCCASWSPSV